MGNACVQTDMRYESRDTKRTMKIKNGISAHSKRYSALSVSVYSIKPSGGLDDKIDSLETKIRSKDGAVELVFPVLKNKNDKESRWETLYAVQKLDERLSLANDNEFSIVGVAGGFSGRELQVKNLRLAFQDSVEVSELAVATNVVKEGQTAAAFSAVITPLATEAGVKDVSVDFMLKVTDGTRVMEFAVPCDWSNAVTVDGGVAYEGSGPTNTLVEAMRFTATTNDVSAALAASGGGQYFGTGATIEYYVCAHYYADSNDPDESKEWEERYYPDNHQVDDSGAWYVIGDYKPVATNMTITGPGLSFRSDPTVRSDGFTFDFRAFSSAGDIVSNGVTVAGVTTTFVAGGKTKVLDSTFTLDGGLTANTSYTVTLIYWTENGQMVSRDMEITTLGTAAAPTLVDRTADSLTVKADGCKAVAMAIACNGSTQWIAYGEGATFNGLEPDCEYEVTVVAVRNLAGVETETAAAAKFYTLPNNPTANVTETPGWGSHTISVTNLTNDAFGAFGNPSNTVYAFYVESVNNEGLVVATNWLGETAGGIEEIDEAMPKWLTLAEWDNKAFRLSLTTTETNNLYLIAGGREPIPDGHEAANGFELTKPSPKRLVKISLFAETVGEAERVAYDPAQHEATYGLVSLTNRVMSPFADGVEDITVAYEYTIDDGATWNKMTLRTAGSIMAGGSDPKINENEIKDILSDDCVSNIVTVTWDSAKDLAADSVYTVAIRATLKDGVHTAVIADVSLKGGELDFVRPTVELECDTPDPFPLAKSPMKVEVKFSKPVTGFTKDSLLVVNGTAEVTGEGDTYTVSVTPKNDGVVTVQVLADKVADQFGNKNKASDVLSRTYDTKPPVIQPIEGEPGEMVVTNGTGFAFTAVATDESMPLKYHWATNGFDVAGNATSELTGEDALEGTNVVTVFAEDNAGNLSMKAKRTWVVDTIAPTQPEISGKPDKFTNVSAFTMTASSVDATRLTYHWTLNDADFTGATLAKTAREGANAVRVYATDEAGNVSPTNSYNWTLDTLKPTKLKIDGDPQEGVVTNGTEFAFTASASDATQLTFHWTTNGVPVADYTAAELSGTAIEGTNTVSVYAKDAAGNACDPTNRTWVVDTIAPTKPEISGKPAALTNEVAFSMTASSVDATRLTYHWTFNDEDFTGATLAKTAREGENAVRVYATDEAGNVSPTNFWNWVVDTQPPTDPVITGIPEKGSITNGKAYNLTAASTDEHLITYHWTLGARKAAVTNFVGTAEDGDGTYTASVYATDAAGNVSGTTTWTWTLDTTAPTEPVISGTPANGSVTNEPNFSLTGAATDNLTTITYHWLTNGVAAADVTNLVGRVEEEGLFEVKCYATDAAGNVSKTNDWSWTLDKTPPTKPVITDNLKKSAITNVEAYDLTAASTDDHLITYHWTLGEKKETVTNFVGSVTSSGEYTDFTAFVYAMDEAGNVSETSSISWRLDTKRPTVTLASTASGHFNRKAAPMEVTATFSEEVTNFTYECVTVQTGSVSNEIETVEEKKVFKFWVYPEHYGVPTFIDEETVSVSIDENKVWDYAGNGNEASRNEQGQQAPLTRVYDTKSPIVNLSSETPDAFNAEHSPLKVTIDVTGKEVTELRQESIIVTNGTITLFSATGTTIGEGGVITERHYALEVTPTAEALITVVVPESVLTNMTGNTNPASEPPVLKTYDNTAPKNLAINGEPAQNKVTAATTFDFEATAEDLTAMKFHWKLNGVAVTDNETSEYSGTVEKGTNWVSVSATDAAGNTCAEVKRTWVVDFEPPENLTLSGTPGVMGEIVVTNGTDFAYKTSATDDTKITYHWMTNGVEVADNESTDLVGTAVEGTNTVAVYATDEADNVSVTNTIVWVVDTIAPTVPLISGTPTDKAITNAKGYSYTAESEDATILTYTWKLDSGDETEKNAGAAFAGSGLADGGHTVMVYATDEAGNKSAATNWTWTVDTTKPTNLKVWGLPISDEKIAVTNGFDFAFEASATDATALKFNWATNGVAVTDITSSNFVGKVGEGTNTVSVFAEDAAGNVCEPIVRTWVVDTIAPTVPVISGTPADKSVTQEQGYSYTAESEDATVLTYTWKLDNGDETEKDAGAAFAGSGFADGGHKVAVYATDEAGNKSAATNWTWTVDTTKPTNLKVWGLPISDEKIVVTNGNDFAFEASATDATALKFHWATNGVAVTDCTTSNFVGQVGEGTNTVSVYAEDAAGNVCDPIARTWVVDTIAPTVPVISGAPADKSVTQAKGYSYTAESEDATILTYIWKLDGGEETEKNAGEAFAGSGLADGVHKVTVYAKDEAGNKSAATNWTWTVDTTKPTDMKVWGLPISDEKIVVTNGNDFAFEANATDATALKFHWATNGVAVTDITSSNFVGKVGEGTNTVSVFAEDAAGNVCEPIARTWVVDTIAPTVPVISGTPADKSVTQEQGYSYTAESEDATVLTYTWKLDNGDETEKNAGEAFAGSGLADGVYKVTVYAKDEAENKSAATNWTWTVDTTKPTNLKVWGLPISEDPEVIVLTNGCDFAFTASATDATALKFIWATNGVTATGCTASNFVGQVSEGTNTVAVYAKDAAGNACDPIERKWVVDLTPPTVELSTETPEDVVFNKDHVFKVAVAFSEDVEGFTQGSVSVENGTVTAVATNSAASYTVTVTPAHDGQVSVWVAADAVTDLAGNGNVASEQLTRTCDVTSPTVTLQSDMYEAFGLPDLMWDFDGTMPVTVTFSEPVVGFTASSVSLINGTVTSVTTNDAASYVVEIDPDDDGTISVWIAQDTVTDLAGNGNSASLNEQGSQAPLTRVCDITPPTKPVISGTPAKGSSTFDGAFDLTAVSEDDSGIYDYVWNVFVNGEWKKDVSGNKLTETMTQPGEYLVEVYAEDVFFNQSRSTYWYWVLDMVKGAKKNDVSFSCGVRVPVAENAQAGHVKFESMDIHLDGVSTFVLSGFKAEDLEVNGLRMRLIVSDALGAEPRYVEVGENARYEDGLLTVTVPGDALKKGGESDSSLFIIGVDNRVFDETLDD